MDGLIGAVLIAGGLWMFISPKNAFNFKARLVKNWGINMSASPKAFKIMKYIGLIVTFVGFLIYFD